MVAYFIASDEHIMIAWVQKFHCKIIFQFDFFLWGGGGGGGHDDSMGSKILL